MPAKKPLGLIAMKTQGSAASFEEHVKKFEGSQFNRHQAVLKVVWADPRITAAVSHMDTLEKMKQNIAAVLDRCELTEADRAALMQYAAQTRCGYCAGCDHICSAALPPGLRVADTLRFLPIPTRTATPPKHECCLRAYRPKRATRNMTISSPLLGFVPTAFICGPSCNGLQKF